MSPRAHRLELELQNGAKISIGSYVKSTSYNIYIYIYIWKVLAHEGPNTHRVHYLSGNFVRLPRAIAADFAALSLAFSLALSFALCPRCCVCPGQF